MEIRMEEEDFQKDMKSEAMYKKIDYRVLMLCISVTLSHKAGWTSYNARFGAEN